MKETVQNKTKRNISLNTSYIHTYTHHDQVRIIRFQLWLPSWLIERPCFFCTWITIVFVILIIHIVFKSSSLFPSPIPKFIFNESNNPISVLVYLTTFSIALLITYLAPIHFFLSISPSSPHCICIFNDNINVEWWWHVIYTICV